MMEREAKKMCLLCDGGKRDREKETHESSHERTVLLFTRAHLVGGGNNATGPQCEIDLYTPSPEKLALGHLGLCT